MQNYWMDNVNRRRFANKIKDLLYKRYGVSLVRNITLPQFHDVAKEIKQIHRECGKPVIGKLSDIDDV